MLFGSIPLSSAVGAILAHSTRTPNGMLKKGRVLSDADISGLRAAGLTSVIAARLDGDDVTEDVAAQRIARLVAGPGTRIAQPFTGRANIFATTGGMVVLDAPAIARLNAIDERLTLATVASHERVTAGQMLATVKIIPFAVPEAVLADAEAAFGRGLGGSSSSSSPTSPGPDRSTQNPSALAGADPERPPRQSLKLSRVLAPRHAAAAVPRGLVQVAAFAPHRVGLILTRFTATHPQVLARRQDAVATRVTRLGSAIATTLTVPHTAEAVRAAIETLAEQKLSPILIFATSAIVDREDVIPAGLVAAGGEILRLGMPVDPGNLLLLGRLSATPVIGLPSCAASLKPNGFDWVLERTLAGLDVSALDIAAMGPGGLLGEIDSRPQPRLGGRPAPENTTRQAPRVAALVLAAGRSTRMGPDNKLLADVAGRTIVRRVVDTALASGTRPVRVVVGHQAEAVRAALAGLDVTFVDNPHFADGLATSLQAGLAALPDACDGAVILLGDMPEIAPTLIDRMIAAFNPDDGRGIVVPVASGKRGNPVLWGRAYFTEMAGVSGDTGAKHLLGRHADAIVEIAADDAVHADIDTPAALAALRERQPKV